MEGKLTVLNGELSEGNNGMEVVLVLPKRVAKSLGQATPPLEHAIDTLMAGPSSRAGPVVLPGYAMLGHSTKSIAIPVVSLHHFT